MQVRGAYVSVEKLSDTQQGLKEWESKSPPSPPGMGWSQRPHSFGCRWVSRQDGSAVLGSQGSSTPSAKATNWHVKVPFPPCWILHRTMFKATGKFSFPRNHFSSHWQQDSPARTLRLRIRDTQHPELLSCLCRPPAATHKESHFIPPRLHSLPSASSADVAVPAGAEVWQSSGAWAFSFHQDIN